jgi:hypothetical protein
MQKQEKQWSDLASPSPGGTLGTQISVPYTPVFNFGENTKTHYLLQKNLFCKFEI